MWDLSTSYVYTPTSGIEVQYRISSTYTTRDMLLWLDCITNALATQRKDY